MLCSLSLWLTLSSVGDFKSTHKHFTYGLKQETWGEALTRAAVVVERRRLWGSADEDDGTNPARTHRVRSQRGRPKIARENVYNATHVMMRSGASLDSGCGSGVSGVHLLFLWNRNCGPFLI